VLSHLERQTALTGNQRRIVAAAALGDMLEYFDYYLIGYVIAFIAGPWQLTFGNTATILLSSGIGAMLGPLYYGRLADRIGRRKVFIITVLNTAVATGLMALTPEGNLLYLSIMRFVAGFGVGGLYCVDLPLAQEFVPSSKRGLVGGLVTSTIPIGLVLASVLASTVTPYVGWRGLFAIGLVPALVVLLIRIWVPESPRWLLRMGRNEEARQSLAWALEVDPASLPLTAEIEPQPEARLRELFRYRRSLAVSWLANLGGQTGSYGLKLWLPTVMMLVLGIAPEQAAFLLIWVNLSGFAGRLGFSYLSDVVGRRISVAIYGFGSATFMVGAALSQDLVVGTVSLFWLLLITGEVFVDGGWAVIGPYSAEVWPAQIRTTGMGSAYAFGGLGKIIGPGVLALIVGSSNVIRPEASLDALVPAFVFLGCCWVSVSLLFLGFAKETKGHSLEAIEADLERSVAAKPSRATGSSFSTE